MLLTDRDVADRLPRLIELVREEANQFCATSASIDWMWQRLQMGTT
jgi:hypothetical protein